MKNYTNKLIADEDLMKRKLSTASGTIVHASFCIIDYHESLKNVQKILILFSDSLYFIWFWQKMLKESPSETL